MSDPTEGLARSVHTRLIQHAKRTGLDPTLVLTRYGIERFLYRLSVSPHADRLVLKGALLLAAWLGDSMRPTRDADFLGFGDLSDGALAGLFQEICVQPVESDGMAYDPDSVAVTEIREDDAYGGKRVTLWGALGAGRIRLQMDIGIGDAVEPPPEVLAYPVILDFPGPRLRTYRPETVVAEKLHAMVRLGAVNTRMKDFFDVYVLSETHDFDRDLLTRAVRATFERRGTTWPLSLPLALTSDFTTEGNQRQWGAFLNRSGVAAPQDLSVVIQRLADFLGRVIMEGGVRGERWAAGGPWGPGRAAPRPSSRRPRLS